jgi:predicted DsbA family dithiol-disulfide isomerase
VRLVVFSDYQCEKCRRIERDVQTLIARFPQAVSVTLRHYPRCSDCNPSLKINPHPQACEAARAAEAAGLLKGTQGFWQMHEWLFKRQGLFTNAELLACLRDLGYKDPEEFHRTMADPASLQGILDDIVEAQTLGIDTTPLIIINGIRLPTWETENALAQVVQELLKRGSTLGDPSPYGPGAAPVDSASRVPQDTALWATVRIESAAGWSMGSGVIVGSRSPFVYVLTAKHVVAAPGRWQVQAFAPTTFPHPANVYRSVEVLAQASDLDLAVVRVTTNAPPPGTISICPPESIPRDAGACQGLLISARQT